MTQTRVPAAVAYFNVNTSDVRLYDGGEVYREDVAYGIEQVLYYGTIVGEAEHDEATRSYDVLVRVEGESLTGVANRVNVDVDQLTHYTECLYTTGPVSFLS